MGAPALIVSPEARGIEADQLPRARGWDIAFRTVSTMAGVEDSLAVTGHTRWSPRGDAWEIVRPALSRDRQRGAPDWPQIAALYGELVRVTDSPVVELNRRRLAETLLLLAARACPR